MDPTLTWIDATEVQAAIAQVRRTAPAPTTPRPPREVRAADLDDVEPLRDPLTLAARVTALARWVERNLQPQRWFLADEQGLAIHDAGFGETRIGELTHSMREWRPGQRPSIIEGVTFHLSGGRRLFALWVRTPFGPAAIALENPVVEALPVVQRAVENAFAGRAQQ